MPPELALLRTTREADAQHYPAQFGYELQPTFGHSYQGYYEANAFSAPASLASFKTSGYNLEKRLFILTYTFTT